LIVASSHDGFSCTPLNDAKALAETMAVQNQVRGGDGVTVAD